MEDNNLFIRVLRFSTEREEFTFEDLCKAVSPNETQIKQLKLLIHNKDLLFQNRVNFFNEVDTNPNIKIFAGADDHFRLLEYQELREARASSVLATRFAVAALFVSIVSAAFSIYFSITAMNSDINVPEKLYSTAQLNSEKILKSLAEIRGSIEKQGGHEQVNASLAALADTASRLEQQLTKDGQPRPESASGH
ncbi:hypothetical protein [Stutzerimonas frequens]|uniref:hypothetical protein n=1 Tax=Stutzerimonas frequens TaxID=2968969 RepID=UPI0037479B76